MYKWREIKQDVGEVLTGNNIRIIELKDKQDSKIVLKNPNKGLYHHYYDNGLTRYLCEDDDELTKIEGLNHLFVRVDWSSLEPQEGIYNWKIIDDLVERFYKPYGLGMAFSVVCKETEKSKIFATPEWVKDAGARGTFEPPIDVDTVRETLNFEWSNWIPDYGDPIFLEKLETFHLAFAKRYQDEPYIEEIVVASIGDWGEGHSAFSGRRLQTIETLKKHIDIFARCYPKNQKYINDDFIRFNLESTGNEMELVHYCIEKGFGIRDDSINVGWFLQNYPKTYTVAKPEYFSSIVPHYPSNLEMDHYNDQKKFDLWRGTDGKEKGADVLRGAIDIMMPTYVSFHGYAREWYIENKELANEVANKCGYWYFLDSVSIPEWVSAGEETQIGFKWVNRGVARAYHTFKLQIKIKSVSDEKEVYTITAENSDNQNWLAYQATNEIIDIKIPTQAKAGEYKFKIKLMHKNKCNQMTDVKIAFETNILDDEGFYEIDSIFVK